MTLREINALSREDFVRALGWVFEDSPWVAEAAWSLRPFNSRGDLHNAMRQQVEVSAPERQLALLRAHPDLGNRVRMSEASSREQAGAGLNQLTPEEHESLLSLNREYRERFGFPFLFAVKGSGNRDIIEALRRRIRATPETELREALEQVYRIAWFRLEELRLEELMGEGT
jgi:2-oxo-4-hydroxy-4-carboxy-5-ureidoimidazoline decarboxylase